jgi:hypothetical protein
VVLRSVRSHQCTSRYAGHFALFTQNRANIVDTPEVVMGALSKSLGAVFIGVFTAFYAIPAGALVRLELVDSDSTPGSGTVVAGQTFTVTARLVSTSAGEKITGVDYYLNVSGAAAGKFRITDRNTTGSTFSDLIKANNGDNGANPGVLDAAFSTLNPRNALDLGAGVANVNVPAAGNATYMLAFFTISIPSNTTPGTYTLSTTSEPGTGWVSGAPTFTEAAFAQQGSYTVTVNAAGAVPEPATTGLVALGGLVVMARRRR